MIVDKNSIFFSFVKCLYLEDYKTFSLNKKFDFDNLFSKFILEPLTYIQYK